MVNPKTLRQEVKETEEQLKKKAEEFAKKRKKLREIVERGNELLISKGISTEEIKNDKSLIKIASRIELFKASGRAAEATEIETNLDKFIESKKKAKEIKTAEESPTVIGSREDLRALEKSYKFNLIEGNEITEHGEKIIHLVIAKNVATSEEKKQELTLKILEKLKEMEEEQRKKKQ